MEIKVHNDGRMQIADQLLDAQQVSALIERLARHRATMQPAVPLRLDPDLEIDLSQRPAMKIAHRDGDKTLLGLRHAGLGWCWFEFDAPSAATLRDYLVKHTNGAPATGLFNDGLPGGVQ